MPFRTAGSKEMSHRGTKEMSTREMSAELMSLLGNARRSRDAQRTAKPRDVGAGHAKKPRELHRTRTQASGARAAQAPKAHRKAAR